MTAAHNTQHVRTERDSSAGLDIGSMHPQKTSPEGVKTLEHMGHFYRTNISELQSIWLANVW